MSGKKFYITTHARNKYNRFQDIFDFMNILPI